MYYAVKIVVSISVNCTSTQMFCHFNCCLQLILLLSFYAGQAVVFNGFDLNVSTLAEGGAHARMQRSIIFTGSYSAHGWNIDDNIELSAVDTDTIKNAIYSPFPL